jgi:hypothetical protein
MKKWLKVVSYKRPWYSEKCSSSMLAAKKKMLRRHFYSQYYRTVKAGAFYKYVKRHKGNRENIPAIKDCNGRLITDSIEKVNSLNSYYTSAMSETSRKYSQCIQVNTSPLTLTLSGSC